MNARAPDLASYRAFAPFSQTGDHAFAWSTPITQRRVAHVTQYLGVGGQERILVDLARQADRERFAPVVLVLGSRDSLADSLEAAGIPVIALETPHGIQPGLWRRLAAIFRQLRIDVVHTHDDRPLIYAMPAAWWAGVKRRVHTLHHGRLDGISRRRRFLVRQAARFVHDFICVSEDSARAICERGIDPRRVRTIHNGIDLTQFAYQGPADNGPIVTVARLSPEKDVANLVRAAQLVVRLNSTARFEIAGAGPCEQELRKLASDLGLTEHVRFLGEVRDIPALLARARLFVLPSQTEGISLTLLEAQARGLPVVATAVGGTPEVIDAGVTGLLAPARDPQALAEAITTVLADRARGRQMGVAGRARMEKCFDLRKMTTEYEALYA